MIIPNSPKPTYMHGTNQTVTAPWRGDVAERPHANNKDVAKEKHPESGRWGKSFTHVHTHNLDSCNNYICHSMHEP